MIFSNIELNSIEKVFEFGKLHQICIGESGRGRKEIRLACPPDEKTTIVKGLNKNYTIGTTKNGKPRINKSSDEHLYLIISTEGGYTRRGNGWIGMWKNNTGNYEVIASGNGADGDAGRIGSWDCAVIKINNQPVNDWIRIRTSGGGYGTSPQWLSISSKGIYLFNETSDAEQFADTMDLEFPSYDEDNSVSIKDTFKDILC